MTQPLSMTGLVPWLFWLFLKLKSPSKGKRFQTVEEIQDIMTGQLMMIGRTMWGPKVPTLKGTEVSLSYVQCFLYLVSSSVNVCIFHIIWLDTFWIDHGIYMCIHTHACVTFVFTYQHTHVTFVLVYISVTSQKTIGDNLIGNNLHRRGRDRTKNMLITMQTIHSLASMCSYI